MNLLIWAFSLMRYLKGQLTDGRILVKVGIKPIQSFEPIGGVSSAPTLNYREFMALVDTGARRTCITQNVIQQLGLKRKGRAEIWNIKRSEQHFTYIFDVGIWPDTDLSEPATVFGLATGVEGIDVGNHQYFDVLLGMDIIGLGSMRLESNGQFEFAFPG